MLYSNGIPFESQQSTLSPVHQPSVGADSLSNSFTLNSPTKPFILRSNASYWGQDGPGIAAASGIRPGASSELLVTERPSVERLRENNPEISRIHVESGIAAQAASERIKLAESLSTLTELRAELARVSEKHGAMVDGGYSRFNGGGPELGSYGRGRLGAMIDNQRFGHLSMNGSRSVPGGRSLSVTGGIGVNAFGGQPNAFSSQPNAFGGRPQSLSGLSASLSGAYSNLPVTTAASRTMPDDILQAFNPADSFKEAIKSCLVPMRGRIGSKGQADGSSYSGASSSYFGASSSYFGPSSNHLLPGTVVEIAGLQKQVDLNGKKATVLDYDSTCDKYRINLPDGVVGRVSGSNIFPIAAPPFPEAPPGYVSIAPGVYSTPVEVSLRNKEYSFYHDSETGRLSNLLKVEKTIRSVKELARGENSIRKNSVQENGWVKFGSHGMEALNPALTPGGVKAARSLSDGQREPGSPGSSLGANDRLVAGPGAHSARSTSPLGSLGTSKGPSGQRSQRSPTQVSVFEVALKTLRPKSQSITEQTNAVGSKYTWMEGKTSGGLSRRGVDRSSGSESERDRRSDYESFSEGNGRTGSRRVLSSSETRSDSGGKGTSSEPHLLSLDQWKELSSRGQASSKGQDQLSHSGRPTSPGARSLDGHARTDGSRIDSNRFRLANQSDYDTRSEADAVRRPRVPTPFSPRTFRVASPSGSLTARSASEVEVREASARGGSYDRGDYGDYRMVSGSHGGSYDHDAPSRRSASRRGVSQGPGGVVRQYDGWLHSLRSDSPGETRQRQGGPNKSGQGSSPNPRPSLVSAMRQVNLRNLSGGQTLSSGQAGVSGSHARPLSAPVQLPVKRSESFALNLNTVKYAMVPQRDGQGQPRQAVSSQAATVSSQAATVSSQAAVVAAPPSQPGATVPLSPGKNVRFSSPLIEPAALLKSASIAKSATAHLAKSAAIANSITQSIASSSKLRSAPRSVVFERPKKQPSQSIHSVKANIAGTAKAAMSLTGKASLGLPIANQAGAMTGAPAARRLSSDDVRSNIMSTVVTARYDHSNSRIL